MASIRSVMRAGWMCGHVLMAMWLAACGRGEAPAIAELAKRTPVTDSTARSSRVISREDLPPDRKSVV
jgi:hypothetical protein